MSRTNVGAAIAFSAQIIKDIAHSLPKPVCDRRRELLPQILREWSHVDLQRHLSLDSPEDIRKRNQKVQRIRKSARELLGALNAADENVRNEIVHDMLLNGRSPEQISRDEWDELSNFHKRLDEERYFLARLASIASGQEKRKPGQPRNFVAYLVLQDAATIFRWFTGEEPTREVSRDNGEEIGPFHRFASVLWPVIFKRGTTGLSNGMKNWGGAQFRYSPLLANIALRHPTWGVYDC